MNNRLSWTCQVVSAVVLGGAGIMKYLGNSTDHFVFTQLEMEPFGRLLIGSIELLAALSLVTGCAAAPGALLAIATMLGAAIAHVSVLGFEVQGDGGLHILLLSIVLVTSGPVLLARRRELPVIGMTL